MSQPGIEPGPPRWEASTLEKSHSNSLLLAIRNIYIRARDRVNFCDVCRFKVNEPEELHGLKGSQLSGEQSTQVEIHVI